jgi:TatD DNase family protein
VHPHDARHYDACSEAGLRELLERPEVRAVGECGLDFNRNFSPPADQERAFEAQLELAVELGRPVFLHERDAHERFATILSRHRPRLPRALIHCFTGDGGELDRYLELDLYVGITGWICDERRGQHLREIVGRIPVDRLMVETDCPYLLPRDLRPRPRTRRNEPCHLPHVARALAEARGVPLEELERSTEQTARAFFDLPEGEPGVARG